MLGHIIAKLLKTNVKEKEILKASRGKRGSKISMMADFSLEIIMKVLKEKKRLLYNSTFRKMSFKNKCKIDTLNKQELREFIISRPAKTHVKVFHAKGK